MRSTECPSSLASATAAVLTGTQTDRQADRNTLTDRIVCYLLWYCSGTDKNMSYWLVSM